MSRKSRVGLVITVLALVSAVAATSSERVSSARYPWEDLAAVRVPSHQQLSLNVIPEHKLLELGEQLFLARFTIDDGFGRPESTGNSKPSLRINRQHPILLRTAGPDANSCAGCHYQPRIGGSGDFAANVFVGAQFSDPPTLSVAREITNERNTISLFGSGVIELLAREMTEDLLSIRRRAVDQAAASRTAIVATLESKGVGFGFLKAHPDGHIDTDGIEGVDLDLVIKPFGVKGVAVSLREFTNFALNHHHGIQPIERFGWTRTGIRDFDGDGIEEEFSVGQVTALTMFQATLEVPGRLAPRLEQERNERQRGEQLFGLVGCDSCHRKELPIKTLLFTEPNPYNRWGSLQIGDGAGVVAIPLKERKIGGLVRRADGTYAVAAFTDLKRHRICDAEIPHYCNEKIRQDFVATDLFLTAKLWDVGTSAPYGHRGDLTTVTEAILAHGAEARLQRERFVQLANADKRVLISFLKSLVVCPVTSESRCE